MLFLSDERTDEKTYQEEKPMKTVKSLISRISALLLVCALLISGAALAEDAAATAASGTTDTTVTSALEAYYAAKQNTALTDYEQELESMVSAGQLTREQADVLLTAAKDVAALRNGVCPNCGYALPTDKTAHGNRGSRTNDNGTTTPAARGSKSGNGRKR